VRIALLAAAMAMASLHAAADEPLWEAGLGIAAVHFPDYRGASRSRAYPFPAPYFVYRGEYFKSDRNGVRRIFFKSEDVDLNVSVGASLPVRSRDNPVREGMPDLKAAIEFGPSLDITLWRSRSRDVRLDVRLPVRGAVTVESDPRFIGIQFFPHANVDVADPWGHAGWDLGLLAGPVFTDARYNRHYYEVRPEFATPSRPEYAAHGGYAGMQFIVALSKRFPKFWVGAFARYDSLSGAAFEDSPLVTSRRYVAGGLGISWIFAESRRRAAVPDLRGGRR